jgi:hypothetical protein
LLDNADDDPDDAPGIQGEVSLP